MILTDKTFIVFTVSKHLTTRLFLVTVLSNFIFISQNTNNFQTLDL